MDKYQRAYWKSVINDYKWAALIVLGITSLLVTLLATNMTHKAEPSGLTCTIKGKGSHFTEERGNFTTFSCVMDNGINFTLRSKNAQKYRIGQKVDVWQAERMFGGGVKYTVPKV